MTLQISHTALATVAASLLGIAFSMTKPVKTSTSTRINLLSWPRMRDDIADEIKDCRDCQRYNISRAGFHPARSITAALPGDHYQVDLAELPRSLDDQ